MCAMEWWPLSAAPSVKDIFFFCLICFITSVSGLQQGALQDQNSKQCSHDPLSVMFQLHCQRSNIGLRNQIPMVISLLLCLVPYACQLYLLVLCQFSVFLSPFTLVMAKNQASNFDNPSSNCKACDWISTITSMSGLLEKCQRSFSLLGQSRIALVFFFFPYIFWSPTQYRRGKCRFRRRKVCVKGTNFHVFPGIWTAAGYVSDPYTSVRKRPCWPVAMQH